ncbi:hypothetical protein POHY109586_14040 [Polaromonas hydrogenivorans]
MHSGTVIFFQQNGIMKGQGCYRSYDDNQRIKYRISTKRCR